MLFEINDVEKSLIILKTIKMFLFTYYSNFKILNKKINFNLRSNIIILFVAIIFGIIRCEITYVIYIMSLIIIVSTIFSKDDIGNSILTTVISLSINYAIEVISIIMSFILNKIININDDYVNLMIIIIIHFIILYSIFKTAKFKYGFSFLKKSEYKDILILNISVTILFLIIMMNSNIVFIMNALPIILIFAIIMFITIQKSLQLYYKQKLLIKELEETKEELANREKEIKDLEAENIVISKKTHTLTHKQKSLEHKLQEIMDKTEISKEEAAEVRDRLKEIEKDLYKEKTTIELSKTGISKIDDMLKYMQSECKKNKIDFELQIKGNIYYMINNLISTVDLETLIADHIKNAIIAINHTDNINKSILVRLGEIDGNYSLYIYDSGIEFEKETLENLGKKPSTTHANEGGTGMGFMNTFDTLRKCKASLIIEEYNEPNKDNYTKAIMIKFDNKSEFNIKSYRRNTL